jgi:UPF0176 protein
MQNHLIILFYKFISIENPEQFRKEQRALCESLHLQGRMLIATEGVNATFEGTEENVKKYEEAIHALPDFKDLVFKESEGTGQAFTKLEIKVKKEIVTLGVGDFDIKKETATEITAAELEELYAKDEDFVVLDLRNDFEVEVGQFEKTYDPKLRNFRDLPEMLPQIKEELKNKKVVAVCTGGIRCEKATCLLKREGFTEIYQLKDGIHTYMQQYPGSHFKGSLFVFDNRMTTHVVEQVNPEIISKCSYCQIPTEQFYSDDNARPSTKVICCDDCFLLHQDRLRSCNPIILAQTKVN